MVRTPGPGEIRPFFFGTDSQLGVKVAWNGIGGPYPDTIKIGYNRKEMTLAPVTLSNNVVRIPSFLATIDTSTQGSNEVGVSWMQYFATGESASFLARQYGVRKAVLARSDPKAAADSAAEKAGAEQHEKVANQAAEMVRWATGVECKLLPDRIDTLVKGTNMEASQEQIKAMAPATFQKKLSGSWAVFASRLWATLQSRPNSDLPTESRRTVMDMRLILCDDRAEADAAKGFLKAAGAKVTEEPCGDLSVHTVEG